MPMRLLGFRTFDRTVGLLSACILAGVASTPASSQTSDGERFVPAACEALVAPFAAGLRDTNSRLEKTHGRPGANRLQSEILAEALAKPKAYDLSKMLTCLVTP